MFGCRTKALVLSYFPEPHARPEPLTRTRRNEYLTKMLRVVETEVLRRANVRTVLEHDRKKQWHIRGWGWRSKRNNFEAWYKHTHLKVTNCVYAIWKDGNCLYVGRTIRGKNRPRDHFKAVWFQGATRIDIYSFQAARDVPRFECLMTHKHKPKHGDKLPSERSYARKCPVCAEQRYVRQQVNRLFPLPRGRAKSRS